MNIRERVLLFLLWWFPVSLGFELVLKLPALVRLLSFLTFAIFCFGFFTIISDIDCGENQRPFLYSICIKDEQQRQEEEKEKANLDLIPLLDLTAVTHL